MKLITHNLLNSTTVFFLLFGAFFFANQGQVQAIRCDRIDGAPTILGINSWNKYLQCAQNRDNVITRFDFPNDIWLVVLALSEILLRVAVYVAVAMIIYAGIMMIISQGSPDKIQGAKSTIENALIGFAIAMLSVIIVNYIGGVLTG